MPSSPPPCSLAGLLLLRPAIVEFHCVSSIGWFSTIEPNRFRLSTVRDMHSDLVMHFLVDEVQHLVQVGILEVVEYCREQHTTEDSHPRHRWNH